MLVINNYPELNVYGMIIRGVKVEKKECDKVIEIENEVRSKWNINKLLSNEIIRAYRAFFWSLRVDPTKERPSSEALVRRLLSGKKLPRINNVVDALNAASAKTLITFSVFDADKLKLPLKIRYASGGEVLDMIGGSKFIFPKEFPLLEDANNEVIAAVIFRDGERTKVTTLTKNVVLLGYLPRNLPYSILRKATKISAEIIQHCAGGEIIDK